MNWPPFRPDTRHGSEGLGDILKHVLTSDDYQRIELITGAARRRRWMTVQKLRIIEASYAPGESVSSVARRYGVAPNLLYRWRRLMAEGGVAAVGSDETVVGSSEVRRLEERVRELERLLGRKTMEVEILKEALTKAQAKKPSLQLASPLKDASRRLPTCLAWPDPICMNVFTGRQRRAAITAKPPMRSSCL